MSDFDEFERQLNENKQGEGAGGVGRRAGRLLASLRVPRHFLRRFPVLSGPRGTPPPVPRRALAHVTARRASARGRGWGARAHTHARRVPFRAPRGSRRRCVPLRTAVIANLRRRVYIIGSRESPPFLPLPRYFRFRPGLWPGSPRPLCSKMAVLSAPPPPHRSRGLGQGRDLGRPFSGGCSLRSVLRTRPLGSRLGCWSWGASGHLV